MNIETRDNTLVISALRELTAGSAAGFKSGVKSHFNSDLKNIDVDCSGLEFLDSSGLGALISTQKLAGEHGGKLRLLSPKPSVLQVLELTRLHRVFEIATA